jgi:muramoyltetrapeptide carboxypeptidase
VGTALGSGATVAPRRAGSVGFFAPSGYLPDPTVMDRAADFFAARGWRVSAGESVFAREQRFAGSDELRAGELQRFATDRSLDVAIAARGGYGLTRILGEFDYQAIAAAGVPLVGYSDFTAFNLALLAQAGGISFQGPAASDFFLDEAAPDARRDLANARFNQEHFFAAISSAEHTTQFAGDAQAARHDGLDLRGRLWGGNLAMVCSLLGTPYFPQVRGGILFLEDVNEPAYRIERLLLQLLQAGVLARQKAIVLGEFCAVPVLPTDNGYDLAAVWEALRSRCPVPIIGGLPLGHGSRRATLAVGAAARITVCRAPPAIAGLASLAPPTPGHGATGTASAPAHGEPSSAVTVSLRFGGHPTLRAVSAAVSGGRREAGRKIPA